MIIQQFLLAMTFSRIALMAVLIGWLIFTDAERRVVVRNCLLAALYMLSSNLINATLVVAVLKVTLW